MTSVKSLAVESKQRWRAYINGVKLGVFEGAYEEVKSLTYVIYGDNVELRRTNDKRAEDIMERKRKQ